MPMVTPICSNHIRVVWIYVDITQNHCEKQLKNILVCRLIMSYNEQEFKDNSSGRGVIPVPTV